MCLLGTGVRRLLLGAGLERRGLRKGRAKGCTKEAREEEEAGSPAPGLEPRELATVQLPAAG